METIPYDYPQGFEWEVDIRSGYQCWKYKNALNLFLMFNPKSENKLRNGYPIISDLAYSKPKPLIHLAKEHGVQLDKRYSKETGSMYVMHICPH